MNFYDQIQQCHSERSEESAGSPPEILRCAQNDTSLSILVNNVHYRALAK